MQRIRNRLSKSSTLEQVENSFKCFGIDFESLDKSNQLVFRENKPVYRSLRKDYYMPDGLCFVHKKNKVYRKNAKSISSRPRSSQNTKMSITMKYPSPIFRIFTGARSTTPVIKEQKTQVNEEKEVLYSPVKPKIIIKRKFKTNHVKKCENFGEISAWESDLNESDIKQ